jgi:hypothetical protein
MDETKNELTMRAIYDEFCSVFLTGKNLEHFLIYVCNASTMETTDPISNMVVLVVSSPVCISLSNTGVKAFKTSSIATIPYYLLEKSQESVVMKLCDYMKNTGEFNISSDSTGGFIVKFPQAANTYFVDKKQTMVCLQNAIDGTVGYGDVEVKKRVYQILSQRISALTVLPQNRKS